MNEDKMIEKAINLIKENDFEYIDFIGSGGFGVVLKVKKELWNLLMRIVIVLMIMKMSL